MKKLFGVLVFAVLLTAVSAFAGPQDFELMNDSTTGICDVQVAPAGSGAWEKDLLGPNICLSTGESMTVTFRGENQAVWDLRIGFEDGKSEEYINFDLTKLSSITIKGGKKVSYQ